MSKWRGIRYREDVGFELRCEQCALNRIECYWPLTLEFWVPQRMTRCRACWKVYESGRKRRLRGTRRDPFSIEARMERKRAYNREWMRRRRAQEKAA